MCNSPNEALHRHQNIKLATLKLAQSHPNCEKLITRAYTDQFYIWLAIRPNHRTPNVALFGMQIQTKCMWWRLFPFLLRVYITNRDKAISLCLDLLIDPLLQQEGAYTSIQTDQHYPNWQTKLFIQVNDTQMNWKQAYVGWKCQCTKVHKIFRIYVIKYQYVANFHLVLLQEFAPSDEELEAYRKGEEWDPKLAEQRRRLKVRLKPC